MQPEGLMIYNASGIDDIHAEGVMRCSPRG